MDTENQKLNSPTPKPTVENKSKPITGEVKESISSVWDDIQLTPLERNNGNKNVSKKKAVDPSESPPDAHLDKLKQHITETFKDLDESFMYLGVLKKMSLPDARELLENKKNVVLKLFEKIWEHQTYPAEERIFMDVGEDYPKLKKLIHSGDAIKPIYDGLKTIYHSVEQFRDKGRSRSDTMATLEGLFNNRK